MGHGDRAGWPGFNDAPPASGPGLRFVLLAAAFAATEGAGYLLHRFLFDGPLWRSHRTHHDPAHGHGVGLEWNDLCSVGFAAASVAFPLGVGVAGYGALSFVLSDLCAHGRLGALRTRSPAVQAVKRAHGRRHRSLERRGQEPYGLFLIPPWAGRRFERRRGRAA